MFGKSKVNLKQVQRSFESFFAKSGVTMNIKRQSDVCTAESDSIILAGQDCQYFFVTVRETGFVVISAVFGHLDDVLDNLLLINEYNKESLYWRAFIDGDGDLRFDYETDIIEAEDIEKALQACIGCITNQDNEQAYEELCTISI